MLTRSLLGRGVAIPVLFALSLPIHPGVRDGTTSVSTADSVPLTGLRWRNIGPFKSGRSVAVAGSIVRPKEYYAGTTGSGVYKTTNGGITWVPVTDGYFGGTIGAVAIAPSNPDIVYVGGGESHLRNNLSHGDGVWKTIDGGKTWQSLGLGDTRHIARILVHPTNPNLVLVGAFGHAFGPNTDRGIFRSTDGGATWKKVLFINDSTGVSEMAMDPTNPSVIYAGFWQAERKTWIMNSGGAGSGIFKSSDGGETWSELSRNPGLPSYPWGRVGITVSGANPQRVYAIIEAKKGGVFRSDDGGATWTLASDTLSVRDRPFYYSRIYADPKNVDRVIVLSSSFSISTDGGKSYKRIETPHGDHHDLWISPDDPNRMIVGEDGGAAISEDAGASWLGQYTPTGQFYRVTTTNHFPYRVCGSQQDQGALCGPSRKERGVWMGDWYDPGSSESGYIAADPLNPDITYTANCCGELSRVDARTGFSRDVSPFPPGQGLIGRHAKDVPYRFNWTSPVIIPAKDPKTVYFAAQYLLRTRDEGRSWSIVSPDLTRNDPRTTGPSGGPITIEAISQEWYATIHTVSASPLVKGLIWTGSDDGLVYLTRDDARRWVNVSPKGLPPDSKISLIDASPHDPATAYAAVSRYMVDDFTPYIYKTSDYGRTWTRINEGIASNEAVRAVRADPVKRGLLYAATERGVWFSIDDGAHWNSLKLNLPAMPVTDLVVKNADLVISTFGRGFWILDDISPLRQLTSAIIASPAAYLFQPENTHRLDWGIEYRFGGDLRADNPKSGVIVRYWLPRADAPVAIRIRDEKGVSIGSFDSKRDSAMVPTERGVNTFVWNMRYPDPGTADSTGRMFLSGPLALPGRYTIELTSEDTDLKRTARIQPDPRIRLDDLGARAQFAFHTKIKELGARAKTAGNSAAQLLSQIAERRKGLEAQAKVASFDSVSRRLVSVLRAVDDSIGPSKPQRAEVDMDPFNLAMRLSMLGAGSDTPPNTQTHKAFAYFNTQIERQIADLKNAIKVELPRVNEFLAWAGARRLEAK
jgi:photosystem II stability/assembly factor-like uncharacterized protein